MTSFCFIANYHLTPLQIAIARRLQLEGIRCTFIAVNSKLASAIVDAGWEPGSLLHLTFSPKLSEPIFDLVPIPFNDLILADRALRHDPENGLRFLYRAAREMTAFLERNEVDFVFSEPTWAHERLAAALCAASGRLRFLTPFTIRYPAGRWAFFEGGDQEKLFPVGDQENSPPGSPLDILDAGPPAYLKKNDQILQNSRRLLARVDRLRRFVTRERIDPLDPTHIHSRWKTLSVKGGEEINRVRFRGVQRRPVDTEMLRSPFVVYALHKQPESSIDVLGRYYEDQSALIRAIWRSLPPGWKLLVKEHTNAIGDRPPSFYKSLSRWPGLEIIDEKTSMPLLLKHTQAVFTVSGTVAYEAAAMGIPAFTFAPMFFNELPRSRRITVEDLRRAHDIRVLINALPGHHEKAVNGALSRILAHSFPGRFTDVVSDPAALEKENIDNLISGFRILPRNDNRQRRRDGS